VKILSDLNVASDNSFANDVMTKTKRLFKYRFKAMRQRRVADVVKQSGHNANDFLSLG